MSTHKTPLYEKHLALGAKMAPFAGWEMPIQYQGIKAEHLHTRTKASVFDICHMGEFMLAGPGATNALAQVVTHNLATLKPGRCRYGFLLNDVGGVLDDLIVYRLEEDAYMLVVNGACVTDDCEWMNSRLPAALQLQDVSAATAKIDLQGPESLDALQAVLGQDCAMPYFAFRQMEFQGEPLLVSRTGYTGELGFELYLNADAAPALWDALLADDRAAPAGLGARDTLRLEVGLPLYGQDLDPQHTPTEAGYGMMLTSEADYVGQGADRTLREQLIGLALEGRRSARHGDPVLNAQGTPVGEVTSGSFAPSLGHAVALAYVKVEAAQGNDFIIQAARAELQAERAELPFYKDGTARQKL